MIPGIERVAAQIGVPSAYLGNIVVNADKFYKVRHISKSFGGLRRIEAPNKRLKAIQRWILRNILEGIPVSERAHGFVRDRSIRSNASYHLNKKYILTVDVKDFFPSVKRDKVSRAFYGRTEEADASAIYSALCTYDGRLPQGAVTSPALSNIVFRPVDDRITDLCSRMNLAYSRYADDMTFSSNDLDLLKEVCQEVRKIIESEGYGLNEKKTRYYSGKNKMVVTGLRLNSGRLTTGQHRKKKIRASLFHYIVNNDDSVNINEVLGNIAFIKGIEADYASQLRTYIASLRKRYPKSKRWQDFS